MSFGFSLALIFLLLSWGRDGRWLFIYGLSCIISIVSLGSGFFIYFICFCLLFINFYAWFLLRRFAPIEHYRSLSYFKMILPILMTLLLEIILAFASAGLGLVPTLSIGLILASIAIIASGQPLSQFCGLLMAADGLLVMSAILSSWSLMIAALAFWGVLALLGVVLLPRLAWKKPEPLYKEE